MRLRGTCLAVLALGLLAAVHEDAVVDDTATISESAFISAYAVVGAYATVGPETVVASRAVIASAASAQLGAIIGEHSVLGRRSWVAQDVVLGADSHLSRSATLGRGARVGAQMVLGYASEVAAGALLGDIVTIGAQVQIGDADIGDNVVIARNCVIADDVVIGDNVIIGPEVTIASGSRIGSGVRLRRGVTVHSDVVIEAGARVGRDSTLRSHSTVREDSSIRSNVVVGTHQDVSGVVTRGEVLADLPPPIIGIVNNGSQRTWAGGELAQSCDAYRHPASGYAYTGDVGTGVYRVAPSSGVSDFAVWCDMDTDGGGWTLVGKVNRWHSGQAVASEPRGWFGQSQSRHAELLLDDVSRDSSAQSLASHGSQRLLAMYEAGVSQSRFVLIAENNVAQRATWYKSVVDATFVQWFSATPHTETFVCTDLNMSQACSLGQVRFEGTTTNLVGMNLADISPVYAGAGVLHMRLDEDEAPSYSGICSSTHSNTHWADSSDTHWGNGLEIWLR